MADEIKYDLSPDAEEIGKRLIEDEKEFAHLEGAKILYCQATEIKRKKGIAVYATAELIRGKNAHLYGIDRKNAPTEFFRILINQKLWELLDEAGQEFVIRHELRHCGYGPRGARIKPHQVELFLDDLSNPAFETVCEVWKTVQKAQAAGAQLTLDPDEDEE